MTEQWTFSPAHRNLCAQIWDGDGTSVVALGVTDDDSAAVEAITKAHNVIVAAQEDASQALMMLLDASGIAMGVPLVDRLYIALMIACSAEPEDQRRVERVYKELSSQCAQRHLPKFRKTT